MAVGEGGLACPMASSSLVMAANTSRRLCTPPVDARSGVLLGRNKSENGGRKTFVSLITHLKLIIKPGISKGMPCLIGKIKIDKSIKFQLKM